MNTVTNKTLIPLDDWNRERNRKYNLEMSNNPKFNGLACPKCTHELMDTSPMTVYMSAPPQLAVHCPHCGYKDYRIK